MKLINFKLRDKVKHDSNLNYEKLKITFKINSRAFLRFSLNSRVSQAFLGFKKNSRVFQDTGNSEMTPLQHCEDSKTEIILSMT